MKANHKNELRLKLFKKFRGQLKIMLGVPNLWASLDVNYSEPRVERLFMKYKGFRVFLHCIHHTDKQCLVHKHRWPAIFKQLKGSYELGFTYSEKEISPKQAQKLPILSKIILNEGSLYEMTQTDTLHYVRPLSKKSYSIMITEDLYPEADIREEEKIKLEPLSQKRKLKLLKTFKKLL